MATGKIFLNYRREDSNHAAGRLHDQLAARFEVVFDVDTIPLGADFVDYLGAQVGACDAMLAMIGPRWLDCLRERSASGAPDFVQVEIEAALARGIPVAPVLVDAATMPAEADLPPGLRPLARRHAGRLTHERFRADAEGLTVRLERTLDAPPRSGPALSATAPWPRLPIPEMIRIEPGEFLMGSAPGEPGAKTNEQPRHLVRVNSPFEIGKFAVTFAEFDAFCDETGRKKPHDAGWGRESRPAIYVSAEDADAYCAWLNEVASGGFRLPSEAEWEYCCRAGTSGPFSFDRPLSIEIANYDGGHTFEGSGKGVYRRKTLKVGSLPPNPWGLHEVHGNVLEWCADCWNASYRDAPSDGSVWCAGECSKAVLRGGSWVNNPWNLRSAFRHGYQRDGRSDLTGFRVARTLSR